MHPDFTAICLLAAAGVTLVIGMVIHVCAERRVRGNRPIADRILVRPIERSMKVGGMDRPQAQAEQPSEGIVVRVGPGRVTESGRRIHPEVEPGQTVSFAPYAGQRIVDPIGEDPGVYLLVRQDELYLNHGRQPEGNVNV